MATTSNPDLDDRLPTQRRPSTSKDGLKPLIEIGWIIAGKLERADREAVENARDALLAYLRSQFADFTWRMPLYIRDELVGGTRVEPTVLLENGMGERDLHHWDFTVLITGVDLKSHHKPYALAAVSRALDSVVISTFRLDPRADDPETADEARVATMAHRIKGIVLHALGHVNGLAHAEASSNFMCEIHDQKSLDPMHEFGSDQVEVLTTYFTETADLRLEEKSPSASVAPISFYLQSMWINRRELLRAFLQAQTWQFPFRLGRTTVAAVSTMLVMILTAEAWDLGMSQPGWISILLPLLAILITTFYVVFKQRLLLRRSNRRLSEQSVLTTVSTWLIVAGGMLATFFSIFILSVTTMLLLFPDSLVNRWAESLARPVALGDFLRTGLFIAAIALGVGSLGASFEGQHYFRHVIYVDEEI